MARIGITEAAARLGVSADTIRRRLRKGELAATRDNHGQWFLDLADDAPLAVPMQPANKCLAPAVLAPAYAPMQAADAALADALRAQVADLTARLDRTEAREADLRAAAERQGRELTAAGLRTAIAETEARALREALAEARRPAWRRWLGR